MAWYALWKWFIKFNKRPYINYINIYKDYLYDKWYESLTDEQKIRVEKIKKQKEEKRIREIKQLMMFLGLSKFIYQNNEKERYDNYDDFTKRNDF